MTNQPTVLVFEARFYEALADELVAGVAQVLADADVTMRRCAVPGCFELPGAIAMALSAAEAGDAPPTDGVIALGVVIEGETDHYEHICREVTRGLMELTLSRRVPLGFGVLTCRTYAQAEVRARVDGKNKGADAAHACLRMMALARGDIGRDR